MCNACGFLCCASDVIAGCGCDHCPEPDCHACMMCGERDCDGDCVGDDDIDYDEDFEITRGVPPLSPTRAGEAGPAAPKTQLASPGFSGPGDHGKAS